MYWYHCWHPVDHRVIVPLPGPNPDHPKVRGGAWFVGEHAAVLAHGTPPTHQRPSPSPSITPPLPSPLPPSFRGCTLGSTSSTASFPTRPSRHGRYGAGGGRHGEGEGGRCREITKGQGEGWDGVESEAAGEYRDVDGAEADGEVGTDLGYGRQGSASL